MAQFSRIFAGIFAGHVQRMTCGIVTREIFEQSLRTQQAHAVHGITSTLALELNIH